MLLIIIFVGFFLLGIADLTLRKRYNIQKNEKFMDQYISRKHFIFEMFICVLFLFIVSVRGITGVPLYVILFIFIAMVFAIRAFLEYVFKRESKKYIISLTYTFIGLIGALFILFLG